MRHLVLYKLSPAEKKFSTQEIKSLQHLLAPLEERSEELSDEPLSRDDG